MKFYRSTAEAALRAAYGLSRKADNYVSVFYNGLRFGVDFTYEHGESVREKDGFKFCYMLLHNWPAKDKPTVEEVAAKAAELFKDA